jgi:hypothetical protein
MNTRRECAGDARQLLDMIGRDNLVIDGVARVEAAKQLGLPRIPCVRIDHLTSAEQRVMRIASNRLAEKGAWSLDDLKIEFEELIIEEAPIDISGFNGPEIDQILLGEDAVAREQGPLAPGLGATAVAQQGDVFLLGDHKIIAGDATDPDVFARSCRARIWPGSC